MGKFFEAVLAITAGVIVFTVVLGATFVLFAAAIKLNWNWYIAPLGVKEIGLLHAIGLSVFASPFVADAYAFAKSDSLTESENKRYILFGIFTPLLAIVTGFIVHILGG